ncbi:unnamed protein product [Clavelina lepadiformis]|uniref:SMB domain-containing protein n=1 Tax=Clavelina lepadiformis TaxID=159417 RepID=A0ABP0GDQ5_CLALP
MKSSLNISSLTNHGLHGVILVNLFLASLAAGAMVRNRPVSKILTNKKISKSPPLWWPRPGIRVVREKVFFGAHQHSPHSMANVRKSSMNRVQPTNQSFTDPLFPKTCAGRIHLGLPRCCSEQDRNCFTAAGCFCDLACHLHFGDCCPDYQEQCYEELKLCLYETRTVKHKVNSRKIKPNACCGTSPYNNILKKCCQGNRIIRIDKDCS